MYKVTIYYRPNGEDELRYFKIYGVYLNDWFISWVNDLPNFAYMLVDVLERKEESK